MRRPPRKLRRVWFVGAALSAAITAIGAYVLTRPVSSVVSTRTFAVPQATTEELREVAGLSIFLGHQSVGNDMLAVLPGVISAAGVAPPDVVETTDSQVVTGPMVAHTFVGENGDPIGKIRAFESAIRGGLGQVVDVAMLKFCYSDFHRGDDVAAIFAEYRDTMAELERDFPNVTFLYSTASLTAEGNAIERAKDRIKPLIGRSTYWPDPSRNVVRHAFNEMVRAQYEATGRLFDLAATQAADGDGNVTVRSYRGSHYQAMDRSKATDPGHQNPGASEVMASAWLATIADAVG